MAHRVMRNKRHQRWTQRLNEIFQEWDKGQNGYISVDTMVEIYRIYKAKKRPKQKKEKSSSSSSQSGLLCCFSRKSQKEESAADRVEAAFHKFDTDGNGFIDWNEFRELSKELDPEQARRIFEACDSSGDRQISLEEFRTMASMKTK